MEETRLANATDDEAFRATPAYEWRDLGGWREDNPPAPSETLMSALESAFDGAGRGAESAPAMVAGMSDNEVLFWNFVHDRHSAWHNRFVRGLARGLWTDNEVVAASRFTNVYRVLDRGTQYAVWLAEGHAAHGPQWLAFHLVAYRFFNRIATEAKIRPALYHMWGHSADDGGPLHSALVAMREAGEPLYTGAYISSYCPKVAGQEPVGAAVEVVRGIKRAAPAIAAACQSGLLRDVYTEIKKMRGFGDFLAYQCALDFTYPLLALGGKAPIAGHLSFYGWVWPGPGARAGLKLIGVEGLKNALPAMVALRDRQEQAMDECGLRFPWLSINGRIYGVDDYMPMTLSLADIEHSLCEFSKYHRIAAGGAVRRRYGKPDDEWRPGFATIPAWD